jgi:single-strand DNA-binding protein
VNIVVVEGRLSRPAELRVLPSGDELVALELTMTSPPAEGAEGREAHESVPVSWPAPAPWGADLAAGAEVVVLGRVRRRFFRAGGTTQSRTEVVAERVVLAGWRRRVQSVLAEATARLDR